MKNYTQDWVNNRPPLNRPSGMTKQEFWNWINVYNWHQFSPTQCQILEECQLMIRLCLKQVSSKLLAESLELDLKELVRVLRWNPTKQYRQPLICLAEQIRLELAKDLNLSVKPLYVEPQSIYANVL